MATFLEYWGGINYLLSKLFLAKGEKREAVWWKRVGWIVYILGLPAWLIILAGEENWIAVGVETAGGLLMARGLTLSFRKSETIDLLARLLWKLAVVVAVIYSLYHNSGLTTLNQGLEISMTVGFILGLYLLGHRSSSSYRGWYWFMLMNASMGYLMWRQDKDILALQQAISFLFCLWGLWLAKRELVREEVVSN